MVRKMRSQNHLTRGFYRFGTVALSSYLAYFLLFADDFSLKNCVPPLPLVPQGGIFCTTFATDSTFLGSLEWTPLRA